jgi:hypothetical protein
MNSKFLAWFIETVFSPFIVVLVGLLCICVVGGLIVIIYESLQPAPTAYQLDRAHWHCVKTRAYMTGEGYRTDCVVYARDW